LRPHSESVDWGAHRQQVADAYSSRSPEIMIFHVGEPGRVKDAAHFARERHKIAAIQANAPERFPYFHRVARAFQRIVSVDELDGVLAQGSL